jgi:deoxyadenosine/deoxycytidine kinase
MNYNYIAIEGNIGAGKTSLATMIAKQFEAKLILEQFEDNAFLPKFYIDPSKYAFPLELTFLAERYQQLKDQLVQKDMFTPFIISDYFIIKSLIFAKKTLAEDELRLYTRLFHIIHDSLTKPDLYIYLYVKVPKLKNNIIRRGRSYEQNIEHEYLEKIQTGYFDFIRQQTDMRILILDINNIDFVHNESDYQKILDVIFQDYPVGIKRIEL